MLPSALPSVTMEYLKPVVLKPADWISDLPQWERLSFSDQIKSEEWMLWMWSASPCSFLYSSLNFPSLSVHWFIFSSGGVHSHWNHGGFLSGNLLKAALGKIFLWQKYSRLIRLNREEQPTRTNEELKLWPIFPNEMLACGRFLLWSQKLHSITNFSLIILAIIIIIYYYY